MTSNIRLLPKPQKLYRQDLTITEEYRKQRETLIAYDILYFIECLSIDRNMSYRDLGQPDVNFRNDRRPDRLIQNEKTGNQIAIEYSDLRKSQQDTQQLAYDLDKFGWSSGNDFPSPSELAQRIMQFLRN